MLRDFFKDFLIYTLPTILSRGIAIVLLPIYTRVISPQDFGALDLFLVFGNIIALTIALEIHQAVARFIPELASKKLKNEYTFTALLFTFLMYSIFLIVASFFSKELTLLIVGSENYTKPFQLALFYIFFTGFFSFFQTQLRFEGNSKGYAIVSLLFSLLNLFFVCVFGVLLNLGLNGVLYAMILSSITASILAYIILFRNPILSFNFQFLKEMLKFSVPLVPASVFVFISLYVDRLMINHFMNLEAVGLYSLGVRIASVSSLIMIGFQMSITPLIYKNHTAPETPSHLAKIFRYFIFCSLLFFVSISFFSHELLFVFTTPEYYGSAPIIPFLVLSYLFSNMYVFMPGIAIKKKTYLFVIINVIGAATNVILNFYFIPLWGIVGAALATTIGYGIVFLIYVYFSQKYYPVSHEFQKIIGMLLLAISATLLIYSINLQFWYFVTLKLVLLTIFFLLLFFSKIITKKEFLFARNTLLRRIKI